MTLPKEKYSIVYLNKLKTHDFLNSLLFKYTAHQILAEIFWYKFRRLKNKKLKRLGHTCPHNAHNFKFFAKSLS